MKKLILATIMLFAVGAVKADDVLFNLGNYEFIVPLKQVNATELFDFDSGTGYPGAEIVIVSRRDFRITGGAAAVIGQAEGVPFASMQVRLPESYFDTADNALWFGLWTGKRADKDNWSWGINASVKLW